MKNFIHSTLASVLSCALAFAPMSPTFAGSAGDFSEPAAPTVSVAERGGIAKNMFDFSDYEKLILNLRKLAFGEDYQPGTSGDFKKGFCNKKGDGAFFAEGDLSDEQKNLQTEFCAKVLLFAISNLTKARPHLYPQLQAAMQALSDPSIRAAVKRYAGDATPDAAHWQKGLADQLQLSASKMNSVKTMLEQIHENVVVKELMNKKARSITPDKVAKLSLLAQISNPANPSAEGTVINRISKKIRELAARAGASATKLTSLKTEIGTNVASLAAFGFSAGADADTPPAVRRPAAPAADPNARRNAGVGPPPAAGDQQAAAPPNQRDGDPDKDPKKGASAFDNMTTGDAIGLVGAAGIIGFGAFMFGKSRGEKSNRDAAVAGAGDEDGDGLVHPVPGTTGGTTLSDARLAELKGAIETELSMNQDDYVSYQVDQIDSITGDIAGDADALEALRDEYEAAFNAVLAEMAVNGTPLNDIGKVEAAKASVLSRFNTLIAEAEMGINNNIPVAEAQPNI